VETVRGSTPHWENGTNINNIMDEQDDLEDDLESNSAKLFERSRIKALAGLHIAISSESKQRVLVTHYLISLPGMPARWIMLFMLLKREFLLRFCRSLTTIFIRHLGIPKRIGRLQFLCWHFCTSCKNLERFGSVTPEFKTEEVVQSASKIYLG